MIAIAAHNNETECANARIRQDPNWIAPGIRDIIYVDVVCVKRAHSEALVLCLRVQCARSGKYIPVVGFQPIHITKRSSTSAPHSKVESIPKSSY